MIRKADRITIHEPFKGNTLIHPPLPALSLCRFLHPRLYIHSPCSVKERHNISGHIPAAGAVVVGIVEAVDVVRVAVVDTVRAMVDAVRAELADSMDTVGAEFAGSMGLKEVVDSIGVEVVNTGQREVVDTV
ncbi:MAG: hypothetical protein KAU14_07790, partial [Thermoplasmata archaeon]|nr:hypothetical protein [Thermoplasmata archaeon]